MGYLRPARASGTPIHLGRYMPQLHLNACTCSIFVSHFICLCTTGKRRDYKLHLIPFVTSPQCLCNLFSSLCSASTLIRRSSSRGSSGVLIRVFCLSPPLPLVVIIFAILQKCRVLWIVNADEVMHNSKCRCHACLICDWVLLSNRQNLESPFENPECALNYVAELRMSIVE